MNIKSKVMKLICENNYPPKYDYKLAEELGINKGQLDEFRAVLETLVDEGKLMKSTKGKYGLLKFFNVKKGILEVTKSGFGFVVTDDNLEPDIFIPKDEINKAMHGDLVLARITQGASGDKNPEGEIVNIIEKSSRKIVGNFQKSKNFGFVVPDDKKANWDIFVPQNNINGANHQDKVVVEIIKWEDDQKNPTGKIIEILGQENDPETEMKAVIKQYDIPQEFPNKVLEASEKIDESITQKEINKRKDYRDVQIVTIDGEDAKDFDDAISIKRTDDGYQLGVHIADVSHYVAEGSVLDKEALKRGNSVYLPNMVIPMLPEKLSNGVCSLKPKVERLAFSIVMEIGNDGEVKDYNINKTVIQSNERMTYTNVNRILKGERSDDLMQYDYLFEMFELMEDLAAKLRHNREERGSIDFDFPEAQIVVEDSQPVEIKKVERGTSNKIIEEFMLLANETIAEHMFWLDVPFIYRVHENPSEEKLKTLEKFIYNFGYQLKGDMHDLHPKEVQELLEKIKGKPEEPVISKMMLRSLKQAKYSPFNEGHFGLAAEHYSHFTSPIRRYPDLEIHRIIKKTLSGKIKDDTVEALEKRVLDVSEKASKTERIAESLERDVNDLMMAEYMSDKIGNEYEGIISSVTNFGMFVQLDNTIEGLIRMEDMKDDYYLYDSEHMRLVGERTKQEYKIGMQVKVKVTDVKINYREIDFVLVHDDDK